MSWYSQGQEAVVKQVEMYEERKKNRAPNRLWLPPNTSRGVIFLDEEGFSFMEHNVKNGNRWEQFTCLGPNNGCPICAAGDKPYQITVFSIIDLSEWADKKGVIHKNEKIIHALKATNAFSLLEKKKRWGGLIGTQVIVTRKDDKDSSAGSDFEPGMNAGRIMKFKLNPTANEAHRPFDYVQIYAPKTVEFIRQALGYTAPVASSFNSQKTTSMGRSAGTGSGAFQTVPDGLEEIEVPDIPDGVDVSAPF